MFKISIEGPDGMGKSTQAEELAKDLRSKGYKVYIQHFPRYDKPIGSLIGRILKGEHPMPKFEAMQMLYAADQTDFSNELKVLEEESYDYVILDRYSMSTMVYYTAKLNNPSLFPTVLGWQTDIVKPDITLVLTKDEVITYKEKYKELDEFEKDVEFMKRTNKFYVHFSKVFKCEQPIELVYADGSIEEVSKRIQNKLKKHNLIK